MHVIRHQAIRVHRAPMLGRQLPEVRQVNQVISLYAKTRSAVNSTLNDVHRDTRQNHPQAPGHRPSTTVAGGGLTDSPLTPN
jgi:hypothetical protein